MRTTGETVALEVLHESLPEALARMAHPGIAHGDSPALGAMEWLEGEDERFRESFKRTAENVRTYALLAKLSG